MAMSAALVRDVSGRAILRAPRKPAAAPLVTRSSPQPTARAAVALEKRHHGQAPTGVPSGLRSRLVKSAPRRPRPDLRRLLPFARAGDAPPPPV